MVFHTSHQWVLFWDADSRRCVCIRASGMWVDQGVGLVGGQRPLDLYPYLHFLQESTLFV